MPVDKEKVIRMLKCNSLLGRMHLTATGDNVVDLLWKGQEKWRLEGIFRRKNVQKLNVVALFLQLTAASILVL